MSPLTPTPAESFTSRVGAALGAVAAWCYRRFIVVGIVVAFVVALATWWSGRLAVDPDITRLLPRDVPSVKAVEALRDRFGGVGYVVLLVEGGKAEERRAFADSIAPKLAALPTVRDVDARRPVEYFADRALYFVDESDLALLRDRLLARKKWEVEKQTIGLDDGPPPPVETADIEARVRAKIDGAGRGVSRQSPYYEDDAGKVLAVFVRPTALASDLTFAKQVVSDVEQVVREASAAPAATGLSVELTGRYKKRVDLQALLTKDVAFTSALAMVLIILYVAMHFRRLLAAVLVLVPLYAGLAVAYAIAAIAFGTLNVLSAFIGAILIGIGIDNGIHMLGRVEEERAAGRSMEEAIRIAFATAGRVSLGAALTSASAFACLAWTDFRAFREFGSLAAVGLLVVLAAYVVVLPALLGAFGRLRWGLTIKSPVGLPFARHLVRFAPAVAWVVGLGLFGVITHAPSVKFDADFSHLDDADLPSFRRDKEVNALLGRSQTPLVILAPTDAQAREAADRVRAQQKALGAEATIGAVATVGDLVPADQPSKQARLREIEAVLAKVRDGSLDAPTRERVERLRKMAVAEPFGPNDLPPSVRQLFATKPGASEVHIVLLFPTVSMGDAAAIARLADQVREIRLGDGSTLVTAGEPIVMADVLATVRRDAPRIFIATLVLVVISLIVSLGRVRLALLALAPAVTAIVATFGLLPMLGMELNYLNMIVLPILLGIGVDDGAHIVARLDAGEPLLDVWKHTGWDVTGAILTDVFGFGVIAFAAHPGLASLGKVALVGLFVNFVAAVLLLPALVAALGLIPALPARPHEGWSGFVSKVAAAGHTPTGPGTVGAVAALPLAWALSGTPLWVRLAGAALVALVGLVAVRAYLAGRPSAKDPQEVVIDETAGCLVSLAFVPFELGWIVGAFLAFRVLDIFKPPPIRWVERHAKGSLGVMGDDLVAGLMAGAALWSVHRAFG